MGRAGAFAAAAAVLLVAQPASAAGPPTVLHISSHLPQAAKAWLDDKGPVSVPGYGSTNVPVGTGRHRLRILTHAGVGYQAELILETPKLMKWRGKGYWCVNLLERSFEGYSTEDCQEEVTDAG